MNTNSTIVRSDVVFFGTLAYTSLEITANHLQKGGSIYDYDESLSVISDRPKKVRYSEIIRISLYQLVLANIGGPSYPPLRMAHIFYLMAFFNPTPEKLRELAKKIKTIVDRAERKEALVWH